MAHKDYVGRGRHPNPPQQEQRPPLPWIRILITFALIAAFGYLLWSIKGAAPEQTDNKTAKQQTPPASQNKPLPKMPKEKWDFVDALDHKTVEVDIPQSELKKDTETKQYQMQCASFRDKQQAEAFKAKMALAGLEPQVRSSTGKNGLWYRVIVGPFNGKRVAEEHRHLARRNGIHSCQIWLWQ